MNDIVIDTNVLCKYDAPLDPKLMKLFSWVKDFGHLACSDYLMKEYIGTGNRNIIILLSLLNKHAENSRLHTIEKHKIDQFKKDRMYKYQCNIEDVKHARLTFLSKRKKMITLDAKLKKDINLFNKIDKIQPEARNDFCEEFYNCI